MPTLLALVLPKVGLCRVLGTSVRANEWSRKGAEAPRNWDVRRRLVAPLLPDRCYACAVETTVKAAPRYRARLMLPTDRNDPTGRKSGPG
jgi:hypothetical protein